MESVSSSPRRMGIEQSSTKGVTPKPTRLMEQVITSMQAAPDRESQRNQVEDIMDSTIHMVPCSSAGSNGMLVVLQGVSPCRDHTISANPGGRTSCHPQHSSHGDCACWVGASDRLAAEAVTVGFECPTLWATVNIPLA